MNDYGSSPDLPDVRRVGFVSEALTEPEDVRRVGFVSEALAEPEDVRLSGLSWSSVPT